MTSNPNNLPECSAVIEHSCIGHYAVLDLWGGAVAGLLVLVGLVIGMGIARLTGLRGWSSWLAVWAGFLLIGAVAHANKSVGSNWLILESLPGLYVCAWRVVRAHLPE